MHFPLGAFSAAFFLLICAFYGNSLGTGIPLMTASVVSLSAATIVGINPNLLEIAPRYSGITMAISNSFGNISGFVAPLLAKAIAVEVSKRYTYT